MASTDPAGRPGEPASGPAPAGPPRRLPEVLARAAVAAERGRDRTAAVAERARSGDVGSVRTRIRELGTTHHALVFSALGMVLFVPALITLAAAVPIGREHGLADRLAHHMALSAEARDAVRELFATTDTISSTTSALGAACTVLAAYAWPAELQRFYASVWELPQLGRRHVWRPLVWLASFLAVVATVAVVGGLAGGVAGAVLTAVLCSPLVLLWSWWTQRLLLAGRVTWSALLPAALATTAGLAAVSVATSVHLSGAVVSNAERYGPIGVVFVLMTWLTWFSVALLGGAVVGHALHRRRGGSAG